ncbi:MAG: low molecular weight protein arginine phosphatase [Candidatus Omnitrophica bacterium]|nr:low molecular weight protein arginine phosphatase [Candidatus Omnitrophota bacterium]MCM8797856.1 low molecular weight protein arginine phosphatase [Candidatus Omnitrophota bacterium]
MIKHILFVCTGNSCRSVMAAGLLKKMLKDKADNFVIKSAGTSALEGMSASSEAQKTMLKEGIDISAHRSLRLTKEMIEEADLILVMEEAHRNVILNIYPEAEKKVYLLRSFAENISEPTDWGILDPIGKPPEVYEEVLIVLKESLAGLIKKFKLDK